ncbi:unnamed protein product [Spirodela intermedia]|uniref:Uncharacterized protein n=1 Tax=Spirodela intermedia TaxID=51605 RepID=A0A7I8LJH9_SPIIN|nr:unnamed protein product [Spirodela intermedia]
MIGTSGGVLRGGGLCWLRCWSVEFSFGSRRGRGLCAAAGGNVNKAVKPAAAAEGMTKEEAYRKIHDLDFTTAARILFTAAPDKKKFGFDFHLVQLFFACMPSLAVYLVAQYARYEIRRMEAEVEVKKKAEEEERAKREEEEGRTKQTEEEALDQEMGKVKDRLEALEEAVKVIAEETKRISEGSVAEKGRKGGGAAEKKEGAPPPQSSSSTQSAPDFTK